MYKLRRVNFDTSIQKTVFERMNAERAQIAQLYRSQGEGEYRNTIGQKDKEVDIILAEANAYNKELRGQADAKVVEIFNVEFRKDPGFFDFYSFIKRMEGYKNAIKSDDRLITTTDNTYFNYLK